MQKKELRKTQQRFHQDRIGLIFRLHNGQMSKQKAFKLNALFSVLCMGSIN